MKKMMTVLMIILLLFNSYVLASSLPSCAGEQAIENLYEYGIIDKGRDGFTDNQSISRREILNALYRVKSTNLTCNYMNTEEIDCIIELIDSLIKNESVNLKIGTILKIHGLGFGKKFDFADIDKDSDDYYFAFRAFATELLSGSDSDGKSYAMLDREATYEEALIMICRLFLWTDGRYSVEEGDIKDWICSIYPDDGHYMYHYAEELKLINSKSPTDKDCPQVAVSELNRKITAYEFFVLLNRALYIPCISSEDYSETFLFIYADKFRNK